VTNANYAVTLDRKSTKWTGKGKRDAIPGAQRMLIARKSSGQKQSMKTLQTDLQFLIKIPVTYPLHAS